MEIKSASLKFSSLDQLNQLLAASNICTDDWRKPASALFKELQTGDCTLQKDDKHGLVRIVDVARVFCYSKRGTLKLVEEKQCYFKTGETVQRGHECICEKVQSHESSLEAAKRGLEEELQIDAKKLILHKKEISKESDVALSPAYKTLICIYTYHDYETVIPDDQWKAEYVEVQQDKCTYFVWKNISDS